MVEYRYEVGVCFPEKAKKHVDKQAYFDISGKYASLCIEGMRQAQLDKGISVMLLSSKFPIEEEILRQDLLIELGGKFKEIDIVFF
ncbi:MAG: hypothetical protein ABIH59_03790 [archaeon]